MRSDSAPASGSSTMANAVAPTPARQGGDAAHRAGHPRRRSVGGMAIRTAPARERAPVRRWLLLTAVVLVAVNLRGPIAAVSPVLLDLRSALGLSAGAASLLTSVPVLCFSIAAPAATLLAARTGPERAISIGLAGIGLGTLVRSIDGAQAVLAGTVVIGVAITVGNVLVPVVIKRDFADRIGSVTGLYTAALAGGAALTAALTAPIADVAGWRLALGVWAVLAVAAWFAWTAALPVRTRAVPRRGSGRARDVWRHPTAWVLALFLGCQSTLYYAMTAWLPTILVDTASTSTATGGAAMSLFQLTGIATTLVVPPLATRLAGQRGLALLVAVLWVVSLSGLLLAPGGWPLWSVIAGLAQGAGISLAFTLVILRAHRTESVAALSGLAQGAGYAMGASGPLVMGLLLDATGGWSAPLLTLLGLAAVLGAAGIAAGRAGVHVDG
ncbi:MAG: MFS transporter [Actinophytocola sp.]|nr:MFS transporter [Actinophytocola sp.]